MSLISIVSPVYNADDCIHELYSRLVKSITEITSDFEIIFVEDGGQDNSWNLIKEISKNDPRVKGIKLGRNFGVHHAITAGLDFSAGDWTVVIECDLQSPPEEIPKLYLKALEGYDVVVANFTQRADSVFRRVCSRIFWRSMSHLSGLKLDPQHGIFRIMSRRVVNEFRRFTEQERHLKTIIEWIGVSYATVDMAKEKRYAGRSSFTPSKLLGATLVYLVAYSSKPLVLLTGFGLLFSLGAFVGGVVIFLDTLVNGTNVSGWASLILSIYFVGGIIIINLGIIGYYVGKNFDEAKKRPLYFVSEKTGNSNVE